MPVRFKALLTDANIAPSEVCLLRHQDSTRSDKDKTPYLLWRDRRPDFEAYQSMQSPKNHSRLNAPYWASFVVTPRGETMLAGFYRCRYSGRNETDLPWPNAPKRIDIAGTTDIYELALDERLNDLGGRLIIDWGDGPRSWINRADKQNKIVREIRDTFHEPQFPGFSEFMCNLSTVESLPATWVSVLRSAKGIYLLTCPRTKEQYVGKASGANGFHGRWLDYVRNGHGGNVGLRSRAPSDYQVSILQIIGDAEVSRIDEIEHLWMKKLQSGQMGLN